MQPKRTIAAILFTLILATPVMAAPRHDDGNPGLLRRFVQIIKHLIPAPQDGSDVSLPKP